MTLYSYFIWTEDDSFHWAVGDQNSILVEGKENNLDFAMKEAVREVEFRKVQDQVNQKTTNIIPFKRRQ